jgi:hypothetical protein
MKVLELPAGTAPGSPEAVAFIEKQVFTPVFGDSLSEPATVPAAAAVPASAYDLIIAGLEMMLDGFKELNNA